MKSLLRVVIAITIALLTSAGGARAGSFDPAQAKLVDLTHAFNGNTVYWPSVTAGFTYGAMSKGKTEGGWWYEAGAFQAPEHGGTHMDAPSHFKENGTTSDKVELSHLIAPVAVIDVTAQCNSDRDYEMTVIDIGAYETVNGPIPHGSIVLMRTGWSSRWPNRLEYLGDDTPGETSNLHFPGFGADAVKMLIDQRGAVAIGLDTASMDPGRSTDFPVHQLTAAAGVPGFENLDNLDQVPARGAWLLALPMKIENGTGGPLRAVAMIPGGK